MRSMKDVNRILIIDDNSAIHDDFKKILLPRPSSQGLRDAESAFFGEEIDADRGLAAEVDSAHQGADGVTMVAAAIKAGNPYHLAFVDMRMPPGWDGLKTTEELWKADPNLQVVICTAYSDNTWSEVRSRLGNTDKLLILKKPFDAIEVSQLTAALTEKWKLAQLAKLKSNDLERLVEERTSSLASAEAVLVEQKGFLELATSVAQVGYWRWDLTTDEQAWSDGMYDIFNLEPSEKPRSLDQILSYVHAHDRERFRAKINEAVDETRPVEFKSRIARGNGVRHILTRTVSEIGDDGKTAALFGVMRDISRDEEARQAIQYAALHDPLTGLANRTKFHDRLDHALELTARYDRNMSIVLLDLNEFKETNDVYGHPVGDSLLRAFAERLNNTIRASDTAARLGGDEFAIIQAPVDDPEPVERLIQRLYEAMDEPIEVDGCSIEVAFCCGIATAPTDAMDADELLRNADLALYNAKREGMGCSQFFAREMDELVKKQRAIELDLKNALKNDEFELHYQPVFDSASDEIYCVEALIRWRHPERGIVPPGDFIEISETTGLIVPIGKWVIRQACRDAANIPENVHIAINVSAVQFRDHRLSATIVEALNEFGIEASRLELEITESVLLRDGEETMQQLHRLQELGIKIAMDDFGTGYSSLSYLRSFPFDRLKLDRSFVMDATTEEDAQAIVRAVANLGLSLGIETTAEGVETLEQLHRVTEVGYTHFQGYLRGRPSPLSEINFGCRV